MEDKLSPAKQGKALHNRPIALLSGDESKDEEEEEEDSDDTEEVEQDDMSKSDREDPDRPLEEVSFSMVDSETSKRSVETSEAIFENNRRYCNATYLMPNDDAEQTRLSIIHQIYLILLEGSITKAPIGPEIRRILDVGTGPGHWAIEIGERYPNSTIIATDIGVFDGGPGRVSISNVQFQLGDAEDEWTFREPFDLVHIRGMSGAFHDWGRVYRQAFDLLVPEGYIEVADADPTVDTLKFPKGANTSYYDIFTAALESSVDSTGFAPPHNHFVPSILTSLGFQDVQLHEIPVPVGIWPSDPREKTLGKMTLVAFLEGLEARCLRQLTTTGRWTEVEVRDLCESVKSEIMSAQGATMTVRFMTGRKPLALSNENVRMERQRRMENLLKKFQLSETKAEDEEQDGQEREAPETGG